MEPETTSLIAPQPSGMQALPSNDDAINAEFDENPVHETNNSAQIDGNDTNLSYNDTSKSSSDINISSFSSENNGGGDVEVSETPIEETEPDPDDETPGNLVGSDQNQVSRLSGFSARKKRVPVAKVSGQGEDVDDDENEGGSGEVDGGEVEREDGVENGRPEVRVSDEGGDGEEEWSKSLEEREGEGGESVQEVGEEVGSGEVGAGVESNVSSMNVDCRGVKLVDEWDGDAVVDSIHVDVGEVVRSGVAVVGEGVEEVSEVETVLDSDVGEAVESGVAVVGEGVKEVSEVEAVQDSGVGEESVEEGSRAVEGNGRTFTNEGVSVEDSTRIGAGEVGDGVAEGREEKEDSEFEVGDKETSAVEDSAAAEVDGVNYTEEGDAVVESINVDAVEAVRSGTAIVGEVGGVEDTATEGEGSVFEDAAAVVEESVAEKASPADLKNVEADNMKSDVENDSIVDGIKVNVVEAIRSGVAVVGDSEVEEPDVKELAPSAGENVMIVNEFAPMVASKSSGVAEYSLEQANRTVTNEPEAPQLVETVEQLHTVDGKVEFDSESKQPEPADELQFVTGMENEKVQPNHVDEKLDSNGDFVEGAAKSDRSYASVLIDGIDVAASDEDHLYESAEQTKIPSSEAGGEVGDEKHVVLEEGDDESSSRNMVEELGSRDGSEMIDGQVVTDSEEEGDSDEEGEGKELFDSAALAALLKSVTTSGSDSGSITITSQDGSRLFSVERPAGLGPSLRSVRPASGPTNSSFFGQSSVVAPSVEDLSEEEKKKLESLQQLKVKFLRLVRRVGYTADHSLASQILYKLTVYAGRTVSPAFSLDNAKQTAMQLEAEGKDDLDLSLNILVLGKTGVGKSALINSIFGEEKVKINAFEPETTVVNEVCGIVNGVKIRFIDAPGLKSSAMEQAFNRKILASVKKFTKKYPPDVIFYVDRLDSQTRDLNDLPMLKTISSTLGSALWRNAIIALTHASSAPPEGPSGTPLTYELFVSQRSHIVQQSIGQAVGDFRLMHLNMMNPVSLVENHPACRKNREGEKVLPNGQAWRPQLLLLSYSVKILSEASATLKPQEPNDPRKLFGFRVRSPPLPYLLSSLLQPRAHPKLSADQGGDNVDSDVDLDDVSDSDQEEEDEYDQLPPFKPLRKAQIAKLRSDQRKAYFEEYDYRVKLLQRKQWREELKRMREMKKNGNSGVNAYGEMPEDDAENGAPAAVPVPLPDMVLPPSFDGDNPAYRYRFLEPTSQFLARPVMDPHSWDHDCGYDGVNVEQNLGIAGRFPASLSVQVTKDKKDFNIHLDSAVSAKHGENGSSLVGFDVQTIGKQYAYIVRGESKFKNMKKNKTAAGVTVTFLGENVATGVKVEDQILLGKRLVLVGSTGTVRSQKDAAYGANLEVRLREADYPIGQDQSSFTLSLMKWRGDLAVGANLQSQISLGRNAKSAVRVSLNNKMSGQITVKTSSTDQLSLALAGLLPIAVTLYRKIKPDVSESYSIY